MSAKKSSDTKIPEDECGDSGFVSGPCDYSGEVLSSSEVTPSSIAPPPREVPPPSAERTEILVDLPEQKSELDSGVVLPEFLSSVNPDATHVYDAPLPPQQELPPIVIFFQPDDDGDTQLHIASVHGCVKSVGTLIKVCPNKALLDVVNDDGHTPLHLAVMSGNAVVTRMLVRAGVELGVRDRTGETPLHKATAAGHVDCLKALLAPVPEQPSTKVYSTVNQKNYKGQACVHLAATAGHLEALQTLVFYGADITLKENLAGWSALHIAARRGDARLVQWLRERCSPLLHARDYAGRSPRRLARRTPAAHAFANMPDDSDSDSDTDDDIDSEAENLFERISASTASAINVA